MCPRSQTSGLISVLCTRSRSSSVTSSTSASVRVRASASSVSSSDSAPPRGNVFEWPGGTGGGTPDPIRRITSAQALLRYALDQERDAHQRAPLGQVVAAQPGGHHVHRLDVAKGLLGVAERGLNRRVRALGRAPYHLDDLGNRHPSPLVG